ncbi:MAG: hypothetical protein WCS64_04715, partial [Dehalococcoidales bacterium]
ARNAILGPKTERLSSWAPVKRGFNNTAHFTDMIFSSAPVAEKIPAIERSFNEPFYAFLGEMPERLETPVKNRAFEKGLEHWGRRNPARISIDETTSTIGRQSIRLNGVLAPGEEPLNFYATQHLTLKPATRYILRADIKRSRFSGTIMASVLERDSNKGAWQHHYRCGAKGQEGDAPGKWGRYETRFQTSDNLKDSIIILYNINSDAVAWFDNIQLIEDTGSELQALAPKAALNLALTLTARDASAKILVNGEAIDAVAGKPLSAAIREGINVIAVDAYARGNNPGVKINIPNHPETDGRWRVSRDNAPTTAWVTGNYNDFDWDVATADAGGYIWTADKQSKRMLMRQVILWNKGHDGPDRCINPLVREWGISENSAETLWKAVYSPFPFPLEDYEFIFDVPVDFRLLDFMHENGRHVLNTRPSGFTVEQVVHDGKPYTRYRIAFPKNGVYVETSTVASRYLLLPVFLEKWTGKEKTTAWYYRRQAKSNFTELQQKIPVRILPPINGRMLKKIMINQFGARPWRYAEISPEHLDQHLSQSLRAGFNAWTFSIWNIDSNPYLKTMHDRVLAEKNGRIILWSNYPFHATNEWVAPGHKDTKPFLYQWMKDNPQARARYFQDSDTWETKGQWCPTYVLGEGQAEFYRNVLEVYRLKLSGLPGTSIIWTDYEQAPWVDSYARPKEGKGSWCFCDRCKEEFRRWANLPADADLSDGNIFASYREKWHSFRSYLDGKILALPKKAANELGKEYMFYSWMGHQELWTALKGNIDKAFPGCPGNGAADSYQQRHIDKSAAFLRDATGLERDGTMGQRFTFFSHYAWKPEQDHRAFWKKWAVMSPTGYIEPKTWKSQVLRVVAAFGYGIDLASSIQCVGGIFYWVGEATRIMAEYEDIFHSGERADELASCDKLAYPNVLVLTKNNERVVLLFNESKKEIKTVLRNKDLQSRQKARIFGDKTTINDPSEMQVSIPAQDVTVVHIK